jgi:hypothetical protein
METSEVVAISYDTLRWLCDGPAFFKLSDGRRRDTVPRAIAIHSFGDVDCLEFAAANPLADLCEIHAPPHGEFSGGVTLLRNRHLLSSTSDH